MNRVLILFCFVFALYAQKRRLTDNEIMMISINNSHSRAVLKNADLNVFILSGKTDTAMFVECAEIAGAKRLVLVGEKGKKRVVFAIKKEFHKTI